MPVIVVDKRVEDDVRARPGLRDLLRVPLVPDEGVTGVLVVSMDTMYGEQRTEARVTRHISLNGDHRGGSRSRSFSLHFPCLYPPR